MPPGPFATFFMENTMPRLTKIYTRKGDDGTTSLGSRERVPKDALRVQAYGTVDELNSTIGVAIASGLCDPKRTVSFGIGSFFL